mgnify:CR=1 FL=1
MGGACHTGCKTVRMRLPLRFGPGTKLDVGHHVSGHVCVAQCCVCLAATESGASGAGSGKRHEPAPESPASSASSLFHPPLLLGSVLVAVASSPSRACSPPSPCWPLGALALPGVAVSQLRWLAAPARSRRSLPAGAPRPPRLALLLAPLRPSIPAPHRNPRATQQDGGQIDGSRCPWRKPARQDCETDSTFAPTKSQWKIVLQQLRDCFASSTDRLDDFSPGDKIAETVPGRIPKQQGRIFLTTPEQDRTAGVRTCPKGKS